MKGWRVSNVGILSGMIALGVYLRAFHLTDRPVWFDEAFSWTLVTRFSWAEMIERTGLDVHPPFYYAVLRCWTTCCGTSPVAMRSLSILFAAGTMVVFYLLCRDVFYDRTPAGDERRRSVAQRAGLVAALLIATSALHVRWSYEARMYTLATALLGLSTWALVRALQSPVRARAWWACYSLSAVVFLYTHNYALFSVAAQWLFLVGYFARRDYGWLETFADRQFWQAAVAVAGAALLYAPWIPTLLAQRSRVQADYWVPATEAWSVPEAWLELLCPLNNARAGTHAQALAAAVAIVCALGLFLWRGGDGRGLVACMIVCPVVLAVLVSLASVSIVVGRHFLFAYMFFLCAVGRVLAGLPRIEAALVLGLLLVNSGAALGRYDQSLRAHAAPGVRGAVEYVLAHCQRGEPIVVLHPCIYFSARYYAGKQAPTHMYFDRSELLHYTGAPIACADDFWDEGDLEGVASRGIWALDTSGFQVGLGGKLPLPREWSAAGETKLFRALYFFEGDVSVRRYERQVQQAGPEPARSENEG